MNRSNLRLLPTSPSAALPMPSPEDRLRAESELAAAFEVLLSRGEREEESPEYEQLEAAVDGRLDPVEAELFASRLAGDPALQREFDELVALRNRLQLAPAASSGASGRSAGRSWIGFAAAAVLLVAVGLGLRQDLGQTPPASSEAADRAATAARAPEPLFADSFEGGSTASWSN